MVPASCKVRHQGNTQSTVLRQKQPYGNHGRCFMNLLPLTRGRVGDTTAPLDDLFKSFIFLTIRQAACLYPEELGGASVPFSLKKHFLHKFEDYCSCFPVEPPLSALAGSSLLSLSLWVMFSGPHAALPFAALTRSVFPWRECSEPHVGLSAEVSPLPCGLCPVYTSQ